MFTSPAPVDFMMRFELGLEKPDVSRPFTSALAVGGSYVVGGLVPLVPVRFIKWWQTWWALSVCCRVRRRPTLVAVCFHMARVEHS